MKGVACSRNFGPLLLRPEPSRTSYQSSREWSLTCVYAPYVYSAVSTGKTPLYLPDTLSTRKPRYKYR